MSRGILALMAGLLCVLAGMKYASALKGDASRLSRWVQVLTHLSLLLREGALSIPEAMCAAADSTHPPDRLLREMAGKLTSTPMLSLSDAFKACSGDCAERDVLTRMFTRLGHGTKDSRCHALEQATEEMRLLAQNASVKAEKDAKLWQTLGFTGGACLTILLL